MYEENYMDLLGAIAEQAKEDWTQDMSWLAVNSSWVKSSENVYKMLRKYEDHIAELQLKERTLINPRRYIRLEIKKILTHTDDAAIKSGLDKIIGYVDRPYQAYKDEIKETRKKMERWDKAEKRVKDLREISAWAEGHEYILKKWNEQIIADILKVEKIPERAKQALETVNTEDAWIIICEYLEE